MYLLNAQHHGGGLRRRPVTDASYIRDCSLNGTWVSQALDIPGFRLSYVTIDAMHVIDLGTAQYCAGNAMFEMFQHLGGVASRPQHGLASLLLLIKMAARQHGMPSASLNALTIGMLKMSGKPLRLKAKAAETRHTIAALAFALKHFSHA